jgi:hypothetical protein
MRIVLGRTCLGFSRAAGVAVSARETQDRTAEVVGVLEEEAVPNVAVQYDLCVRRLL